MAKIVVLGGAGAMGQITVQDLASTAKDTDIVIADIDLGKANKIREGLDNPRVTALKADIKSRQSLVSVLKGSDVVVNATPYYFNRDVMKAALEAGVDYIDLGGLYHETLKQLELHDEFAKAGRLAILGMGSTPGTTNVMAAAGAKDLDTVSDIIIYCAGEELKKPEDNHPFFPPYMLDTILDEYTMDAIVFKDGKIGTTAPIAVDETVDFGQPVGVQSVIHTVHSELATIPNTYQSKGIKNVAFKLALGQEFHDKVKFLVELGFGGKEPVKTSEGIFHPRKILQAMIDQFPKPEGASEDCEILRVVVSGTKEGKAKTVVLETLAQSDPGGGTGGADMNTGVPPSIVAQMVTNKMTADYKGVLPPEICVEPQHLFKELGKRKIMVSTVSEGTKVHA